MRKGTLLLFILFVFSVSFSQTNDTNIVVIDTLKHEKKPKNPNLAIALSAFVPGAGQIYNGKFWKVPFIYGGFYASYYFTRKSNWEYQSYRNDIQILTDSIPGGVTVSGIYSLDELANDYNVSRRKRDLYFLTGVAVWSLNIIDAYIDAELSNFDVSEDLSMRIYPSVNYFDPNNPNLSLTVQFYFK